MQLDEQGFIKQRRLPDDRTLSIDPLTFGRAKINISEKPPFDQSFFADLWDYPSIIAAILAFDAWNPDETPEPDGWNRHPATGRYRINGDKDLEYVKWDAPREEQVAHAIRVTQGKDRLIEEVKLRETTMEDAFPDGTTCYVVRSIETTCTHDPLCEWYDHVFCYLDRCVVLSMTDMHTTSMGTLRRRLQE